LSGIFNKSRRQNASSRVHPTDRWERRLLKRPIHPVRNGRPTERPTERAFVGPTEGGRGTRTIALEPQQSKVGAETHVYTITKEEYEH